MKFHVRFWPNKGVEVTLATDSKGFNFGKLYTFNEEDGLRFEIVVMAGSFTQAFGIAQEAIINYSVEQLKATKDNF